MTLLAEMETVIEDTQFGDPTTVDVVDEVESDGWCRCMCFCKTTALRSSNGIEMAAGVDFGK